MSNKQMKLSILTNMVAPYRVPFFKAVAGSDQVSKLEILTCVGREVDRQWDIENDNSYKVKRLGGITLNLNKGTDAKRILHFRFGIFISLIISRPDILIIGDASWTSFLGALACKLLGIRYVVWNEITTRSKVSHGIAAKLRRWMYRGAAKLVASCQMAKDFLLDNGVPDSKIGIVNNAVDNEYYLGKRAELEPQRSRLRDDLGIGVDAFCFIYVGQLISRKRVLETLDLIAKVSEQTPVHLIVAGTGPLEGEMKNKAKEVGFESISFCGYAQPDRLCELYVASDALILLSEDEPWGMVVNEALLFGKPYLVSDSVAAGVELVEKCISSLVIKSEGPNTSDIQKFIEMTAAKETSFVPNGPIQMAENLFRTI